MKMNLRDKLDEITLLELFWTEPKTAKPEDGYWCYEVTDAAGNIIRFGMDAIAESVQIELINYTRSVVTLSFELVDTIEIIELEKGQFAFAVAPKNSQALTRVQVELRPYIKIQGYTLRNSS